MLGFSDAGHVLHSDPFLPPRPGCLFSSLHLDLDHTLPPSLVQSFPMRLFCPPSASEYYLSSSLNPRVWNSDSHISMPLFFWPETLLAKLAVVFFNSRSFHHRVALQFRATFFFPHLDHCQGCLLSTLLFQPAVVLFAFISPITSCL